jgi:hypothetical protein
MNKINGQVPGTYEQLQQHPQRLLDLLIQQIWLQSRIRLFRSVSCLPKD